MPLMEILFCVSVGLSVKSVVENVRLNKQLKVIKTELVPKESPKRQRKELFASQKKEQDERYVEVTKRLDVLENYLYAGGDLETNTQTLRVEKVHLEKSIKYEYHYLHRPVPSIVLQWDRGTQKVTPVHILDELLEIDKKRTRDLLTELSKRIIQVNRPSIEVNQEDLVFLRHKQIKESIQNLEQLINQDVTERLRRSLERMMDIYAPLGEISRKAQEVPILRMFDDIEDELLTYK